MPAYKDSKQGTWYASFYFENWQGVKQKKLKRGFATKKDALAWEREFLFQQAADLTMTFEAFVEIYITDKKKRLRENTWFTKEHIIRTKILPYFKEKRLSEIKPRDVIAWQNEMLNYRDKNGKAYSPTYLKTLHGQLSAILNHAVRFYGLKSNAAATAGCMGSEKHKEMLFWTKEEYLKFAEVMMDKPQSYYAFEVLYWCGIREGELLALTPADFDLDKGLLSITKSYQRLKGRDVITDPKTPKSVRVIQMPSSVCHAGWKSTRSMRRPRRSNAFSSGGWRLASSASCAVSLRPSRAPYASSCGMAHSAPARASASRSAASVAKRL